MGLIKRLKCIIVIYYYYFRLLYKPLFCVIYFVYEQSEIRNLLQRGKINKNNFLANKKRVQKFTRESKIHRHLIKIPLGLLKKLDLS